MENQLHSDRKVFLSELVLDGLYENLGFATYKLKGYKVGTNFLLVGPYWLLQLWLNETFELSLRTFGIVNEKDPNILNRIIEGNRLLQLTLNDDVENLENHFTIYVMMF